jgi:sigma-B regulation protein RsbU (phosphoserine phosphatase)
MRIDLSDGTVEYVNAGHMPMLVSLRGEPFAGVDESKGLIAGILDDNAYDIGIISLEAGDRIVLYTDGVTEARNESRHFYGPQRLTDFLNTCESNDSAGLVEAIFGDTSGFSGNAPQSDDVTVVAVGYNGAK